MPRLAALLLCALIAGTAVTAAPAPLPRPWVTGWDKPLNPLSDCRFDRKGDKLTIAIPGGTTTSTSSKDA